MGITKIKWVEELSDMGKLFFFFFICLHFCCSNKQFLALIKQKGTSNTICVFHSPVILLFAHRVSVSFAPLHMSVRNDTETLAGCFERTILQHQAASLFFFHSTVFHRNPLLGIQALDSCFFHSTSWWRVTCLVWRPVVREQQKYPHLFSFPFV